MNGDIYGHVDGSTYVRDEMRSKTSDLERRVKSLESGVDHQTRRQWLAGLAMQARTADLMTIAVLKNASFNFGEWLEWLDEVPKFAYKLADAMLAYEEKETEP